jgi:predicted  nucleic acid-binding Zn-ribbon protein
MITAATGETYRAGGAAEAGSYKCRGCGMRLGIDHLELVPACPACGGTSFRRAPLFDAAQSLGSPVTEQHLVLPELERPDWLDQVRELLSPGDAYLVHEDDGSIHVVALEVGWSRIGRSASSDIRLDDPTVSRRHALVVHSGDGETRVLDDRSMNGVCVNGETVEWGTLADGDELGVGRFRIYFVALEAAVSGSAPASVAGS